MALMDKKRYRYSERRSKKRIQKKKGRPPGLPLLVGLAVLVLGALIYFYFGMDSTSQSNVGVVDRVEDPSVAKAPKSVKDKGTKDSTTTDNTATDEEADSAEPELPAPAGDGQDDTAEPDDLPVPQTAPSNSAMRLTIPKLGINNALVSDDVSEEGGLAQGVGHLPGTGFPWISGSNTYIAGHRLGYPGTPSDHIFFSLPSMGPGDEIILKDADGQTYTYRVSGIKEVSPYDLSVTEPTGSDSVSLQVCIEDYGDYTTLGPDWNVRFIVQGNRVA